MIWNIKKQKTNNQNNKKKKESKKKNEDNISNFWENLKRSNMSIIVGPEEEKEQEIGNLFEKIVKENFLNLVNG